MPPVQHLRITGTIAVLACLPGNLGLQFSGPTPASKIQRLLLDIHQSTTRAAEDADLVFATLDTYGQQLEVSLENEIGGLNKTLSTLIAKRVNLAASATTSENEIRTLGAALAGSQHVASSYEKGSGAVEKKFDNIFESLNNMVALLQNAAVAPNGVLVTSEASEPGSTKVLDAVRHLVQWHSKDLASKYSNVVHVFKREGTVRFTPLLLSQTVAALQSIKLNLHERKHQSLEQFEVRVEKYSSDATAAGTSIAEQRGLEAENSQKSEEISSSIAFTKSVLQRDLAFADLLSDAEKARTALVSKIRELRLKEERTLQDLLDILSGKYNVKNASPAFLQTSMHAKKKHPISSLQTEIEAGLRKKVDLHSLLMKVKASFDHASASFLDAENVRGIMASLQDVLHDVEGEQSRADEVKRKCDNQMHHAKEEEEALKANIVLINMARSHTDTAIQTVKQSIRSIEKKTEALSKSVEDCEHINSQAMRTLKDQARDRSTILVALSRAVEVAEHSDLVASSTVVTLLRQLAEVTQEHELQERMLREQQTALKNAISQYFHKYSQSLKDRGLQYKDALAALKLHTEEIADDEAGQKDSLVSSLELQDEDKELCQGIIKAYDDHSKRRLELIQLLKRMIPKVPEILTIEARQTD